MKIVLLFALFTSISYAIAEEHHIFQAGKSFIPKVEDKELSGLKNSRGKYKRSEIKKVKITEIEINAGDTITFHNKDNVIHNVFGKGFNFNQEKESIIKKVFKEKGERIIRCAIHPKMKLKIKVK